MKATSILSHYQIEHIIRRIAFQILETFVDEKHIVMAGISSNGFVLAVKISEMLRQISGLEIALCEVFIDKQNPYQPIKTSLQAADYQYKAVVLVDDVLNSGTTLIFGVKHFLEVPITKLKTAVLIDRNHKKFPVKVDFKGISLSTSAQNHVSVVFESDDSYAQLS